MSLAIITVLACFITEAQLGKVIGVVGAIMGSSVIYIIPALLNYRLLGQKSERAFFPGERVANVFLCGFGILLAFVGTKVNMEGSHHH